MDAELLEILACPKCRGSLTQEKDNGVEGLSCPVCAVVYPVRDGIPVMLIEEALSPEAWKAEAGKS